jgi:uncharacterized protein YgiM (DUF1202 family)
MKKLLLLTLLFTGFLTSAQNSKLLASCCAAPEPQAKEFGRCSGDAYCTACKNCSACKHCSKEGGSCGVCASYAAPVVSKPKKAKAAASTITKPMKQYKRLQMLEVTSETLNVRDGAGTNFKLLETINQGDMVTYISHDGEWLYIRVNASGTNGWVNYKFVK